MSKIKVHTIIHDIETLAIVKDKEFIITTKVVNKNCKPKIRNKIIADKILLQIKEYIDNICGSKKKLSIANIRINTYNHTVTDILLDGNNNNCNLDEIKDKIIYDINEKLEQLLFTLCYV